jgi:hypothetical protein
MPEAILYEMKITATGEVRDSEGNLVETVPVEITQVVDAETARSFASSEDV